MAPTAGSVSQRWTDEEDEILVQMTNDQLLIEQADESKTVSWRQHWNNVSARLREQNYNRSVTACRAYWNRSIAFQDANEKAAAPRWSDSEYHILVFMAEEQLEKEKEDDSCLLTWGELWKKVSDALQQNGYTRTPDQCEAFWMLIQNGTADVARIGSAAGDQPRATGGETDNEGEDQDQDEDEDEDFLISLGDASTRQSSKADRWINEEYENLFRLLKSTCENEKQRGTDKLARKRFWIVISQMHLESGYDRGWEDCYTYWQNHGRSRSGFDERAEYSPDTNPGSILTGSQPSNPSSIWSPVNEVGDVIVVAANLPRNDPTLPEFQKSKISSTDRPIQTPSIPGPLLQTSINLLSSDSETSDYDMSRIHEVQKKSTQSQTPIDSLNRSSYKRSSQLGDPKFRFTADQRQVLATEVKDHGAFPDINRREELARQLGVEERSIKNWFVHFRQTNPDDSDKYGESPQIQRRSTARSGSFQSPNGFQQTQPSTRLKRRHTSLTNSARGSYTDEDPLQLNKKPRLGNMNFDSEQAIVNKPPNGSGLGDHLSIRRNSAHETSPGNSPQAPSNGRQPRQAWTPANTFWNYQRSDTAPQASWLSESSSTAAMPESSSITQTSTDTDDASTIFRNDILLQSYGQTEDHQERSGVLLELSKLYVNTPAEDLCKSSSKTGREVATSESQPETSITPNTGCQNKSSNACTGPDGFQNSNPRVNHEGICASENGIVATSPLANKSQQVIAPLAIMTLDLTTQQSEINPSNPAPPPNASSKFAICGQERRNSSETPQPATAPAIAGREEEDLKIPAVESVTKIRSQIRDLNRDKTTCGVNLGDIEEEIGKVEADENRLEVWKAHKIREIEVKYQQRRGTLVVKLESLNEKKRKEEVNRDRLERKIRRTTEYFGMYQKIVDHPREQSDEDPSTGDGFT